MRQTVEDMEDHIFTDTYKTEKSNNHVKKQDKIYSEILLEVRRLNFFFTLINNLF